MSAIKTVLTHWSRAEFETYCVERTRSQYLGDGHVLCQILGDRKFIVQGNDPGLAPHMIFDGFWEYWLSKFFGETINPGDTVIDIGANYGYFTVLAGALNGPHGTIFAYDPNPRTFGDLSRTVNMNGLSGRTQLFNAGVGNVETEENRLFFLDAGGSLGGRVLKNNDNVDALEVRGTIMPTRIRPIREAETSRVDFIKIDVGGDELDVLDALSEIIEAHDPTIVCDVNFGRDYSFADIAERLGEGDRLQFLDGDAVVKPLTEELVTGRYQGENLLIVRMRAEPDV